MLSPIHQPLLSLIPLFAGLSSAELDALAQVSHLLTLPKRTNLLLGDSRGDIVYFLLEGTAKVYTQDEDETASGTLETPKIKTLAIIGPNEVVGVVNALIGLSHAAQVLTLEPMRMLWMSRSDFLQLEEEIPQLSRNLSRLLAKRLRQLSQDKFALSTMTVERRVAYHLMSLAQNHHEKAVQKILQTQDKKSSVLSAPHPALPIPIRINQSDLADMVSASRMTVNTALKTLKEQKIISMGGKGNIAILNLPCLQQIL